MFLFMKEPCNVEVCMQECQYHLITVHSAVKLYYEEQYLLVLYASTSAHNVVQVNMITLISILIYSFNCLQGGKMGAAASETLVSI